MEVNANIEISKAFEEYIQDWDYKTYLLIGGYGSGKSWHTAFKIVLKCLQEKRLVLVARKVFETIRDSCFSLFKDILDRLGILQEEEKRARKLSTKVLALRSPMEIRFPNGSRIIFKGLDDTEKIKSIHGVSIVWMEECSEMSKAIYQELIGRVRENNVSLHFFLTCNPVGKENWVYRTFFEFIDNKGKTHEIMNEEKFYKQRTIIGKNNVYYHHSVVLDNPFVPKAYIKGLQSLREQDEVLYNVAFNGRFGVSGIRVLPNFMVAKDARKFKNAIADIPVSQHYFGLDFGFEESYNALLCMAVDDKNKYLYIYDEVYLNHLTDDRFARLEHVQKIKNKVLEMDRIIIGDSAEPKAIQFYRQEGFPMRGAKKYPGSRLQNTRKIKRFRKIICSPKCQNTIRELSELTYAKDKEGNYIYDEFNIDSHSLSSIAYALDSYTVAEYKADEVFKRNSKTGNEDVVIMAS